MLKTLKRVKWLKRLNRLQRLKGLKRLKKLKKLKRLKREKDSNILIFTKNASHYNLYERRFFYSSKLSSVSEIGSSTGNSVAALGALVTG